MIDMAETVYRITVQDIYEVADSMRGEDEGELTDEVVEKVKHKIEAMDFSDMADTINIMIDAAIDELS